MGGKSLYEFTLENSFYITAVKIQNLLLSFFFLWLPLYTVLFLIFKYFALRLCPVFRFWGKFCLIVMCEEVEGTDHEHHRIFNSGVSHIILSLNCCIFCLRQFSLIILMMFSSFHPSFHNDKL